MTPSSDSPFITITFPTSLLLSSQKHVLDDSRLRLPPSHELTDCLAILTNRGAGVLLLFLSEHLAATRDQPKPGSAPKPGTVRSARDSRVRE
jgi:hypothetical protein